MIDARMIDISIGLGILFALFAGLAWLQSRAHEGLDKKANLDAFDKNPSDKNSQQSEVLVEVILAKLPQTQCGQCDYPGCAPYAKAVAQGEAHNKCPPGGQALVDDLALLLNRESASLETQNPIELVAIIREEECIGCAKCGPVCPTDAIIGASKTMHTVILPDCTGCELCLPPCPVDCIDLVPRDSVL